jgi:hypothetical protein
MPKKGYKQTEEQKETNRLCHLGQKPWNKGLTKETDERVKRYVESSAKTKKGQHVSPKTEFKKGCVSLNKGKKATVETKQKQSLSHLGKIPTEETRKKQRESRKKYLGVHQIWNKGKKGCFSEETIVKQRDSHKKLWQDKEYRRKVLGRRTPSSLEIKMIRIIEKLKLPYIFVGDGKFWIENINPDFINCNGEKIAIEVFYKKHKEMFRGGLENWKQKRIDVCSKYGWRMIFLDETQVDIEKIRRID